MNQSDKKPNRLKVFGKSMMNKLPKTSRNKRKRQASKIRRQQLKREDSQSGE